jgi:hypothetical protein
MLRARSLRCVALVMLFISVAPPWGTGPLRAQTALPRPQGAPLEKVQPQPSAPAPSAVTGQPSLLQARPLPAGTQGQAISVTCPASAAPAAVSTDARSSGWLVRASWAPFMQVRIADPASANAGAVVECVYGHTKNSIGGSMPMFLLSRNAGAGIKASACTVSGDTATCAGGGTLRCPARSAHVGTDRIQGADWTFETGWPSGFMQAKVADPPSTGAGAVVDCAYGPMDVTTTPTVVAFTLRRNLGAGIDRRKCAADPASRTVTCTP